MHRIGWIVLDRVLLGACSSPLPEAPEYTRDEAIQPFPLHQGASR